MLWFVAVIFLIITVILFSGKGAFLIAGYNTSSKAEKSKHDEKKLCRVMGSGMGVMTAFFITLACFGKNPPSWMFVALPIVIITTTIVMLVLCSTICKAKKTTNSEVPVLEEKSDESKHNKKAIIATLIFTAVVFLIVGVTLFTGEIKTAVEGNNIKIVGSYWSDYNVELDSVKSISFVENLDTGKRTNGMGSYKLLEGNFRNNDFGNYILYSYLKCENYIVLDTNSGIVVVNAKTNQETESLYKVLKEAVDSAK